MVKQTMQGISKRITASQLFQGQCGLWVYMNLFVFAIGAQVVEATGVRFGREAGFHPGKVLADAQAFGFPKPKQCVSGKLS